MEKDVLVSINGIQFSEDNEDSMEVISQGTYYYKNDKHYIVFDEAFDDGKTLVKNVLKISNSMAEPRVELIKKGGVGTHMVFEKNKNNMSCYETEAGSIMLGFQSKHINVRHSQDKIDVLIEYSMEMNYEHVSDNKIEMSIRSKSCTESLNLL